jgi:putative ABC transport system permease protein
MSSWNFFDSLKRDLSHAVRSLSKDRAFALVCIISLGIGIGAMVALATFTRMLLSPARGIDPHGLVEVLVLPQGPLRAKAGEWALEPWSYPDYQALRDADTGMAITGWARESSEFGDPTSDGKAPPRVATMYVSSNYFSTFGVSLSRGTGFDPAVDDGPSAEARVVLSDDFWKTRMSSDPAVIGKSIKLDGVPYVVTGVTPAEFRGHFHFFQAPGSVVFVPLERHPRLKANANLRNDRATDWVRIHARLHDGVDLARASGLVTATMTGLAQRFPSTNEFKSATVEPYRSIGAAGRPESQQIFAVLYGLTGAVLLIVCLNISGMMLVRGARRERELSIRAALGADRRRLLQHLFFEAVCLAFAGGAASAFVLFGIPAIIGWWMKMPVPPEIDFDATGAAIAAGLCLVVSVLFGLLPAIRFSLPNLLPALKDDSGGGGRKTIRVHRIAVMVQVAIAIPFLVVSGVMIDRTRTADFGFPTDGLVAARLPKPSASKLEAGFSIRKLRDNLQQASGVRAVAVAAGMPIDFDYREFRVGNNKAEFATAQVTRVGENFLEAVGAPLLRGRTITADDGLTDAPVAVISEPLAKLLFAGREAIGERVSVSLAEAKEQEFTVIGVSADFATSQLTTIRPQILLSLPAALGPSLYVITRGAPGSEPHLKSALEAGLRDLGVESEHGVAFPGIVTGQELVEKSKGDLIAEGAAVGVAGGLVLILSALGIVGVVGFMVATRTREIAVRMALGSSRLRVFRLMLVDIVKLVVPGVVGGLFLAAILIRTMNNVMGTPLTLGTKPLGAMEPAIYAIASLIAVGAALLAGLPAARRATTVQPMVAIKSE